MIARATLVALALAAPSVRSRADAPDATAATRVRTVRPGAPSGTALVPASVAAERHATLSTRVAAAVREVRVREGQRVAAGELLVSLSDSDVRGALAAAESAFASASAHERRVRYLVGQGVAPPADLETAQAQRAEAQAAVAQARATLAYTEIRAPFAATVQARHVDPGDLVGPGQPLLELEGDTLEIRATLSEREAAGVSVGDVVRFQAGPARGEAVVTALTPGGDALSHRRTFRARVRSVDDELRTGTFARIEVPAADDGSDSELWIPRSALVERGDLTGVFVASAGRAELRWIALGERTGDLVAVRAGLRPGDAVVDAPAALRDGQAVEVSP